jgi:hypothetical protein
MFAEDCNWILKQTEKYGRDEYPEYCKSFISYWEYRLAIDLYLRAKGRFDIKDGELIEKEEMKLIKTKGRELLE